MDYKKIMNFQLKKMNAGSKITNLPKSMVLTPDDMVGLERDIGHDIVENENILARSEALASRCSLM